MSNKKKGERGNMVSLELDLAYLSQGLEELETYLLSDVLFWPLSGIPPSGGQPFQRLTLGGLHLARARLKAQKLRKKENHKISNINSRLEQLHHKWRVAWVRKVSWEFRSRINQWENFLNELRRNPKENAAFYGYEVRIRVMLHFLKPEADDVNPEFFNLLEGLDNLLKALLKPDGFIWDERLSDGFPKQNFWYLWGDIREQ
jgi:hypothetical protein